MTKKFVILALLMLAACAPEIPVSSHMIDGNILQAPMGWIDYCLRNLGDPSC